LMALGSGLGTLTGTLADVNMCLPGTRRNPVSQPSTSPGTPRRTRSSGKSAVSGSRTSCSTSSAANLLDILEYPNRFAGQRILVELHEYLFLMPFPPSHWH
jgi:hypothetical protein